jgi:hypothetical protein
MATNIQASGMSRGDALRAAWHRFKEPGTSILGQVFSFLSSYPPLAQGIYYLILGLWGLFTLSTVTSLNGPGASEWLLAMSGVLLLVIGGALCLAAYRRQGSPEVLFLAFASAGGLIAIDCYLIYRGFSILHLFDAILQGGLVAFWVQGWRRSTQSMSQTPPPAPAPPAMRVGS